MKTSGYISILALACLTLACAKEQTPANEGASGSFTVSVTLPAEDSKTGFGPVSGTTCQTIWKEGDCISINGVPSLPLSAEEAGSARASFHFSKAVNAPYNVISPASEDADRTTIPSEQKYVKDDYDASAVPMSAGSFDFENISLHHNVAVLRISLTGKSGVSVKTISVMTGGGEPLCGTMKFSKRESGLFDGNFAMDGGASCVTLNCTSVGVALTSAPTDFNIAIPAGKYSSSFNFIVQTTDNQVMKLEFEPKDGIVKPGSLIQFPVKEFLDNGDFALISSEEDLMAFAASHTKQNYLLTENLDMTDYTWEPFDFSAVFDGGGHTIKGLSAPMFNTMSGNVKNLTFNSKIKLSDPVVGGFFASEVTGIMENFCLEGSYSVNSTGEYSSTVYVGGIAGRLKSSGSAVNCRVNATITAPSTMILQGDGHFGAFFGQINAATIQNCVHEGNLEVSVRTPSSYVSKAICVGSIAGSINGGISNGNSNRGKVTFNGSWLNTLRYGGISGYVYGNSTCSNDTNYGYVLANPTNTDSDKARYGGVGGVYGIVDNVNISITNAVNEEGATVEYRPASSPSYSFNVGGVIQAIYKNAKEISGLVNRGSVIVDGSEISITSSRRGLFAGGVVGTSVCLNMSNLRFDGTMELTPLMTIGNAFGGIIGQMGENDPSVSSSCALSNSTVGENARIIVGRKYPNQTLMVGGIAGMAKTCNATVKSCQNYGNISVTGPISYGTEIQNIGGILGMAMSSKTESVSVTDCYSNANISVTDGDGSVNVCIGGITGSADLSSFNIKGCRWEGSSTFGGAVSDARLGGILGMFTNRSAIGEASVSGCDATGLIYLVEDKKISERPVAGGIVAYTGSRSDDKAVKLTIDNCRSACEIRRYVSGTADVIASRNSTESIAGGILGAAGLRQAFETEDVSEGEKTVAISVELVAESSVDVNITSCENSGWIFFNPNNANEDPITGGGAAIEISPNFSISGGIVGVSAPTMGKLTILECNNYGDIFNTSGTLGGVVGYMYCNTNISRTNNSGHIFERDCNMELGEKAGTSYVVAGGLVGSVNAQATGCSVENCWNSGDVAGSSSSAMETPCAGGLVGSNQTGNIFKHCKTSGHVRNYARSGSANNGAYFCGSRYDGNDSVDLFYECGAGGWVARNGEWIAASDNWADYAYASTKHGGLNGSVQWDNKSKLPWEE